MEGHGGGLVKGMKWAHPGTFWYQEIRISGSESRASTGLGVNAHMCKSVFLALGVAAGILVLSFIGIKDFESFFLGPESSEEWMCCHSELCLLSLRQTFLLQRTELIVFPGVGAVVSTVFSAQVVYPLHLSFPTGTGDVVPSCRDTPQRQNPRFMYRGRLHSWIWSYAHGLLQEV